MRALLAVAELRFRGAATSRLTWLVPLAFALAFAAARWAPGLDAAARAASADAIALSFCGAVALAVALLLGATGFADDIRTGRLQGVLAAPVARFAVLAGGVLGHAAFASVLLVATALAATLGLEAGGLGSRARRAVQPVVAAEVLGIGPSGFADLDLANPVVRVRFRAPEHFGDGTLRVHLAPRGQMETGSREDGVVEIGVHVPGGRAAQTVRQDFKAGVPFFAQVPVSGIEPGAEAELSIERPRGAWRLRFGPGSVTVGHERQLFAWNVVKAALCAIPLLLAGAAVGAVAASRLGVGAAAIVVSFVVVVFVSRDVVGAGSEFILARAAEQAALDAESHAGHDHGDHDHGHHDHAGHDHGEDPEAGHDHSVRVTPFQTAVARAVSLALRAVPAPADHWRFGDLADGRAVTPRDIGRSAAGTAPLLVFLAAAGWFLLRRREFVPA